MQTPLKILVKFPSRERPERFFKSMDALYNNCSQPELMLVLITCDLDDRSMCNPEVVERISKYKNAIVNYGNSQSKIHAINKDFDLIPDEWKDWGIVVNLADDMIMNIYGWDGLIRADMATVSPDLDLLLHYLDTDTRGALATMYIAGRKFYERFNYVYNPIYHSLFCDNEIEDMAKMLGKWHYTGYSIYTHYNSAYGHKDYPKDELFIRQQEVGWSVDQQTYNIRKSQNFGL
jgi:hypothetical protein